MILVVLQVLVPLLLIGSLAFPGRSRLVKAVQIVAVGLYILLAHLAGLWLIAPWWTAWVLWGLFGIASIIGWRRTRPAKPAGLMMNSALAVWGSAALGLGWLALSAFEGRRPPDGPVVNLASPLPSGQYLVVSGGSRPLINAHLETLHPQTARQASYRGQSYGVDIVGLRPGGRTSDGWQPREPQRHAIFGIPVLAPCAGTVISTLDNRRDMPVPLRDPEVMTGNHVVLRCGGAQVVLAHLQRGSVEVPVGQEVRIGERLGKVGNSGNSDAPHLHIHAQRPGSSAALFAADPLPIRLDGRYLVRGDRL